MAKTARNAGNQDYQGFDLKPLFLGADAPPLEGEGVCVCGASEGEHLADGSCPDGDWLEGAGHRFASDASEEQTRPDIQVEYEPGCEPAGVGR